MDEVIFKRQPDGTVIVAVDGVGFDFDYIAGLHFIRNIAEAHLDYEYERINAQDN